MASVSTTLCLPASLGSLAELSNALYDFVAPFALDSALVYQVDLASCEAFTNIVKHAVNYDDSQNVIITLSNDGQQLMLTLADNGVAIPDEIRRELGHAPSFSPDPLVQSSWPEGGMGLLLIQSMMDNVSYQTENGRNILTLTKQLSSEHS
ncbi:MULTISPECIES: ATP-binding protein [unclassified Serratia (in: enterobacteria)]|uniref:ATP-binding protein n=1 Tax=unclassified Serratia (in: enterobacteria) TaxID=2647522 RepID=UPI0030760EBC